MNCFGPCQAADSQTCSQWAPGQVFPLLGRKSLFLREQSFVHIIVVVVVVVIIIILIVAVVINNNNFYLFVINKIANASLGAGRRRGEGAETRRGGRFQKAVP